METTFGIIADIRRHGTTVLMVEQNAYAALQMCDRAYLLTNGRIVRQGTGAEMLADEGVRTAYLGG
jgi:branched-chain amino acid transport system ATP-binding protein